MRGDRILVAVDHEHRALHPRAEVAHRALAERPSGGEGDQRLGVGLQPPADGVLDLLRRMRLRHALRDEELDEAGVVAAPVVGVELRPALVGVERLVERDVAIGVAGRERERRRDEDDALDPLRVLCGENQRPLRAEREGDHERLLGPGRVQHRERVRGELGLGVGVARLRPVGLPVPARVENDHAVVPCEVRNLHLPAARVDERPRRHEQDRRLAFAVDLVEHADAVPLDVALGVRVAGARLLARLGGYFDSHPSIQSSSCWWPSVIPDRRSRMIPSLNVITSETSASSGISIP